MIFPVREFARDGYGIALPDVGSFRIAGRTMSGGH